MPDQKEWLRCRVQGVVQEISEVRTFKIEPPPGRRWNFLPGQFVQVRFPGNPGAIRAYSIGSSPLERGPIEISLRQVGPFTQRLFSLEPDDFLEVRGPFGKFVYREGVAHSVLIAGGTGIVPYRSFVRYVQGKGLANRLTLVYSARVPAEILYRKEMEEAGRANPNIKFYCTVTRPHQSSGADTWKGRTGRITLGLLQELAPDFAGACFYLCGSNRMIHDLFVLLRGAGIPENQITFEKWGDF